MGPSHDTKKCSESQVKSCDLTHFAIVTAKQINSIEAAKKSIPPGTLKLIAEC
jgi:hypothetical protein